MAPLPPVGQSLEGSDSDAAALNRLTPLRYEQPRRLARRHMVGKRRCKSNMTALSVPA
jgi:hypothetical protein